MTKNKLLYGVAILCLIVVGLLLWNNYQVDIQERIDKPVTLPSVLSGECGIEQCHGYDLTCGPDIPKACTSILMLADTCRQYARCEGIEGSCQMITDPKFEQCKACVDTCEQADSGDSSEPFECVDRCLGL